MLINKLQDIFQKSDKAAFKLAEGLLARPEYQKLIDLIASLEEKQQKMASQFLTLGIIFFPFLVALIINFSNSSLRFEVATYKEISEQIQHFNFKSNELSSLGQTSLGPAPITGQEDLNTKIKTILTSKSISAEKVSVISFDDIASTKHLKNIEASLSFKDFTLSDLNVFLNSLTQIEKFKILEFQIDKNISSTKLGGVFKVLQMAKDQSGTL